MSYAKRHDIAITTSTAGAATVYSEPVTGRLVNVIYKTRTLATTADFTITAETSGQSILTHTNATVAFTKAPRQQVHNTSGTGLTTATAATGLAWDHIYLDHDRVKVVVAQGGVSLTGTITVVVA